jgi:hypothetical protein
MSMFRVYWGVGKGAGGGALPLCADGEGGVSEITHYWHLGCSAAGVLGGAVKSRKKKSP